MAKHTVASLLARILVLETENTDLKEKIHTLIHNKTMESESKPKLPGGAPTSIRVEDSKVLATMRWALRYVGFSSDCTDEFLMNFEVYTNAEKNWLGIYPKAGSKTGSFIREFNQARFNREIQGNYWKNHGVWMNIPAKKQ